MRRTRWSRIGLTSRVHLATLGVGVALGAVFAVQLHTINVSRERDAAARHSADVLESASGVEGSVIDLEMGLRGYIISRKPRYLEPYVRARGTQPQRLASLERLVAQNPAQRTLARQLTLELDSYVHGYAMPVIAVVRAGRRVTPAELSDGKRRVDHIRTTLARFTSVEDRLQIQRRAAAESATNRARLLTILGLALLVLVVIASSVYASRFVADPLRRLSRSARRLAGGRLEERVEPAGVAEVRDLGVAFNQMAASLERYTSDLERLSESSAAQFSAFFEQTPIGLVLFDRELRCIRANPALSKLAGVEPEKSEGSTASEAFGRLKPDLTAAMGRVLDTGEPLSGLRVSGGGRTCTVRLFPVHRAQEELIGVAAVVVDVTERERRLERERKDARQTRQLERLTSTISEALSPREISRAVVAEAADVLGGDGAAVVLLDEERGMAAMSAGLGWPLDERAYFSRLPLSLHSPLTDAIRTRSVIHVGAPQDAGDPYPELAEARARHGVAASLALPLLSGPRCLGGLLVTFSQMREFDDDELHFASEVAERCATGIARALLYEREHETAAALQSSLLPTTLPNFEGVVFAARFQAAGFGAVVGGDFYDVVRLGKGRFVAWIGDVQGKGPAAAAVAALARYTLRAETRHETKPARLVEALNEAVLAHSEPGERLLTVVCVAGEARNGMLELEIANAGHPPPLVVHRDRPCFEWTGTGPLIGFENAAFASDALSLEPGALLVLYTDGLTDSQAPRNVLGPRELCRLVDELAAGDLGELLDVLLSHATPKEGGPPRDDIALLGLHFAGRAPRRENALARAEQR